MHHEIIVAPAAVRAFKALTANQRATVRDALERFLRHQPSKVTRSRIKRLQGLRQPQYRLRVGELRVFYDVQEGEVHVLAIVTKEQALAWPRREGSPDPESGSGEGQG